MATVTLTYLFPRNGEKESRQLARAAVVTPESPVAPNELTLLALREQTPRAAPTVVIIGAQEYVQLVLVYIDVVPPPAQGVPTFAEQFPTQEAAEGAVRGLWMGRLEALLQTRVAQETVAVVL